MARKSKKTAAEAAPKAPTSKLCPVCVHENPAEASTCSECGYAFGLSSGPKTVGEEWLAPEEVIEGTNSRMIGEANYLDTVKARAISLAIDGQLSPAEGRKLPDGTVVLDYGYTRRDAVRMIREGFEAVHPISGEKTMFHDPDRKLWVRIVDTTAQQAFLRAIKENIERKDTTDLQEALAQNKLRTDMGWSDTRIARFYGYDNQNRVMALKKLLALDEKTQNLVHEGKLALYAALLTAEPGIDAAARESIIAGATEGDKVRGEVVKKLVRDFLEASAPPPAEEITDETPGIRDAVPAAVEGGEATAPGKIKRSVKEFKAFVAERNEDPSDLDPKVLDLLNAMVHWFDGKKGFGDKALVNRLWGLAAR